MKNHTDKKDADLVVGYTSYDPKGWLVYHPSMMKLALLWAVGLGLLLGGLAYMIASGQWPVRGLGQFSTSDNYVATFVGASLGVAIGGLTGVLQGFFRHWVQKSQDRDIAPSDAPMHR